MAMRNPMVRAISVSLAALGLVGALLVFLVRQPGASATDLRATPGTTWLSGEAQGQVVLAAVGGELASLGVAVGKSGEELDVVDVGSAVFVYNRTAGELVRLAGVNGDLKERFAVPKASTQATALVRAGVSVYLVDQVNRTAQRVNADGSHNEPVKLPGFTNWVGTEDGHLWLVDAATGDINNFDGLEPRISRALQPGADAVLTAVGTDPVIVDRTNGRLRWLRRGITFEPSVSLLGSLVQQPSVRGSCLQIVTGRVLRCFSPLRQERMLPIVGDLSAGDQLFVNERNALITSPGNPKVLLGSWRTKNWAQAERPAPSARPLSSWANPGPLLVDDPGSRFAMTADDAHLVLLDKASHLTSLSDAGQEDKGVGIAGATSGDPNQTEVLATQAARNAVKSLGGPNLAPIARPDLVITRSGRSVAIAVLANDTDPNGDVLAVIQAGPPGDSQGRVVVSDGQIVNYMPPDGFVGQVTFPYTITDTGNLRSSSTVTVDVIGGDRNTPPRLADDAGMTLLDTGLTIDVLANDRDDEGDPLTITRTSTSGHGTVSLRPEGIRYDPNSGFTGNDEFTYTVIDGYGGTSTATVRIVVTAPQTRNRPPLAVDDRATVRAGRHVIIPVLANDVDPDGDPLHIASVSATPGLTISILDGQTVDVMPNTNISGPVSFTYVAQDPGGLSSRATVILLVDAAGENRPPVAIDDRVTSAEAAVNINVLSNDSDPNGDLLTIVDYTQPEVGRATKVSGSVIRFEPAAGYTGTQTFTYTISDPAGLTATARVTVEVIAPTGSGPVARDDFATVFPGESVTIKPLANDSHPDGIPFSLRGIPTGSAEIKVLLNDTLSFTPPDATLTSYKFSYTIQDTNGRTATAQIVITVIAKPVINRAPVAKDDRAEAKFGGGVSIPVLANDSDPDGDQIHIVDVTGVSGGSATVNGANIDFTAAAQFSGLAVLTYTIADPAGLTASAKVVVQVADRVKLPPIAVNDSIISIGGARVSLDPLANDSDPDGPASGLVIQSATPVSRSVSVALAPHLVTIQPPSDPGIYVVNYVIVNADGLTASATITVTVQAPPNHPPVANADAAQVVFNGSVSIPVLNNDTDVDGGTLTITAVSIPTNGGTAVMNGSTIRYTPAVGYAGTDTFTYTIVDPQGAPSTATVTVTVAACSAVTPVLVDDSAFTKLNTAVTLDLFANDTETAGMFAVTTPNKGTVTSSAPGRITYTPPSGFSGTAQFGYRVTNDCGVVANATITISITINHPPIAKDDTATVTVGGSVTIPVTNNDSDPDGDPFSVTSVTSIVNGTATHTATDVSFTPTAPGPASFSYTITDVGGLTSTANVTINVASPNRPPTANGASANAVAGSGVVIALVYSDPDPGDVLTVTHSTVSPAGAGSVSINGSSATYTPPQSFFGDASFTYTVTDTGGLSATATVTITVAKYVAPNQAPTANPDGPVTAPVGAMSVVVNVVANDTDPDPGDTLTVIAASVTSGSGVSVNFSGGNVTVMLDAPLAVGTSLPVSVVYTISDGHGHTASSTVAITFSQM